MSGAKGESRFGRRQWRRRLRALLPAALTVCVVGLLGFGFWVLFLSTWLAVEGVEVDGTETVATEDVVAASGIDEGTPLVRVDLGEVTDRIEELPAVAEASVHRSWPHTVTITVTEREPVAAISRQATWWVMDDEGVVFRRTGDRDPTLPIVQAPPSVDQTELAEVAAVIEVLPTEIVDQTRRVKAASMDSITLVLDGHRRVVWGSAAESDRKLDVLEVLMEHKARVYDVSVPEQPTIR